MSVKHYTLLEIIMESFLLRISFCNCRLFIYWSYVHFEINIINNDRRHMIILNICLQLIIKTNEHTKLRKMFSVRAIPSVYMYEMNRTGKHI